MELSGDLFTEIEKSDPAVKENLQNFKDHLARKISHDLTIRKERRNSTSFVRPRAVSTSTKRSNDEKNGSKTKIARPSLSQPPSS